MVHLSAFVALLQHRLQSLLDEENRERGALSVEATILIGGLVAIALVVVAFIAKFVNDKLAGIQ